VSNTKHWWGADRPPRAYAEALLQMQGDPDRQQAFMETHIPENEDFRNLVRDHYKTALSLGGKEQ